MDSTKLYGMERLKGGEYMKLKSFLIGVLIVVIIWVLYLLFRGAPVVSPIQATSVLCHQHTGWGCMEDWKSSCNSGWGWHSGACPAPTSTPTPTQRPTSTPTCTPKPTMTPDPTPTDDPQPTPEPTPVVDPCENWSGEHYCGWSPEPYKASSDAPKCGKGDVTQGVVNPHVYRKGDQAIVKWWNTAGNKAHIYYKLVDSKDWQHSVTVDNTGYFVINGLGTRDFSFAVQQVDDCSGGVSVMSKVIVDGNESNWVLFR